jgi:hypothetical protein
MFSPKTQHSSSFDRRNAFATAGGNTDPTEAEDDEEEEGK